MKTEGGHWYRIRFLGSTLESPLEQARMLKVISDAMAGRARRARPNARLAGWSQYAPPASTPTARMGSLSGTWTTAL